MGFVRNSLKWLVLAGCLILMAGLAGSALAQNSRDTLALKPKAEKTSHTPSKATILAAVIPGAGQFYNRKYWKVPIVYTGYAVAGYMFNANQKLYRDAKKNYLAETDTLSSTVNQSNRSSSALLSDIDNYRRYRDLSVLALLAWHGLTIIDANVDAHFLKWDVSEDLSLRLRPRALWVGRMKPGMGLSLTFNTN